jgi:predicted NAD-dependent protein-ADP-ribosyltransferase YbiA (DUF1768 family)
VTDDANQVLHARVLRRQQFLRTCDRVRRKALPDFRACVPGRKMHGPSRSRGNSQRTQSTSGQILANELYRAVRDPDWASKKVAVLEETLRAMLIQHPEAQEALRKSSGEDIIEDSPDDYFWGEGADGSGQNMLGQLWMKIRSEVLNT